MTSHPRSQPSTTQLLSGIGELDKHDSADARKRLVQLTSSELCVLEVLSDHYDESCLYSRGVVDITGLNFLQVRRAIKSLVRKGLAELHRGIFDDDGQVAGSGYSATRAGCDLWNAQATTALQNEALALAEEFGATNVMP